MNHRLMIQDADASAPLGVIWTSTGSGKPFVVARAPMVDEQLQHCFVVPPLRFASVFASIFLCRFVLH